MSRNWLNRKRRKLGLFKFCALLPILLVGYIKNAPAQIFRYKQISVAEGLPSWEITSLLEDKLGYLWIGTMGGGLAQFDGKKFIVYTVNDSLPDNNITSLKQDRLGNIWIGTTHGLVKYDGVITKVEGELAKSNIKQVEVFKDSVFFVTQSGSFAYIGNNTAMELPHELIDGLFPDSRYGSLYYQDKHGVLKVMNSDRFAVQLDAQEKCDGWLKFRNKYLLVTSKGVFQLEGSNRVRVLKEVTGPLIYDEPEGSFWFGQDHLNHLKFEQGNIKHIDSLLRVDEIECYLKGSDGNIWIGTRTKGLWQIHQSLFEKIYERPDNIKDIVAVEKDSLDETLWLGTQGTGIIRMFWDGKQDRVAFTGAGKNYITVLRNGEKCVWIGTMGGIGKWQNGKVKWYGDKTSNPIDSVLSVEVTREEDVWIGRSNGGLWMKKGESFSLINDNHLNGKSIKSLKYWDAGKTLFVGTTDGVYTYDGKQVQKLNFVSRIFSEVNSLSIYRDKFLVVGLEFNGVILYNLENQTFDHIQEKQGLSSSQISFVSADGDNIWVGAVNGLNRLKLDAQGTLIEVEHFDTTAGYDGLETYPEGYSLDKQTKLFASVDGIYRMIKSDFEVNNKSIHPLHFIRIMALDKNKALKFTSTSNKAHDIPHNTSFSSDKNTFYFQFNQVNKADPDEIQYRWILEGYDSSWSSPGRLNEVFYTGLNSGNYKFKVETISEHSHEPLGETQYAFSIEPPFYTTKTFKALSIIFLLVVVGYLTQLKMQYEADKKTSLERVKHEEAKRLRQEIARDFHDEIGNHLAKITNNVGVLKMHNNGNGDGQLINRIEQSVKLLNIETKDFIWNINPSNNSVDNVFLYIRDFGDRLFRDATFDFRANEEIEHDEMLTYETSRQVILIFKEGLTNILKYAKPQKVTWTLREVDGHYAFSLVDDGVGFLVNEKIRKGGLSNMRFRAQKINADLFLDSRPNYGTRIDLMISFNNTKLNNAKYMNL